MATGRDVIAGLVAIASLSDGDCEVCAEHDQIWARPAGGGPELEFAGDAPQDVIAILADAGWFWDDDVDSWSCFM